MRIVGIGIDAVEIERVERLYERFPVAFFERVFTPLERRYCLSRKRNFGESLAARWAAKEAALKALGTGWSSGVSWTDVEVENNESGAPVLNFYGGARDVASRLGVVDAKISISHCKTLAFAYVTLSAED